MSKSISVYIPTYNRPALLDRALASLTRQSVKDFQVLVCDDGSGVSYDAVTERYRERFMDFQYVRNPVTRGGSYSRNRLIMMADGEYITGLDDDDEFLPFRLQDFIESPHLRNYAWLSTGHLTRTRTGIFRQPVTEGVLSLRRLLSANLAGNQVFARTADLRRSGGFDVSFPAWQDYDAWTGLCLYAGEGYKLAQYTYQWNIDHEGSRISSSVKARKGYEFFVRKYDAILTPRNRRSLYFQDIINRNAELSIQDILNQADYTLIPLLVRYQLKRTFPGLKEKLYKVIE